MRAYQDMVFSTAARIVGNDAQAQDLAQETFLKAYENFEQLQGSATAGGWLKTVVTNLSLNHVSRYKKRWRMFSEVFGARDDEDEQEINIPLPDTQLAEIDAEERHALIEEALKRLPEHQRIPLVLYHFEEMPYEDIAARLGVSLAKVKTDIHRARAALAAKLARVGLQEQM